MLGRRSPGRWLGMSNSTFRRAALAVGLTVVAVLVVTGAVLIRSDRDTAPQDFGVEVLGGAVISAVFLALGWLLDTNARRREQTRLILDAVTGHVVELKNAAELARFFIPINHSVRTYRDRMAPLISGRGTVSEDVELIDGARPPIDGAADISTALNTLLGKLDRLTAEYQANYQSLADIARDAPDEPDKHRPALEKLTVLEAELGIAWKNPVPDPAVKAPLIAAIDPAIAQLRRRT